MSDGGLRQLFAKHLPEAHHQAVETWSTGQGVPDLNLCLCGYEAWIEMKLTEAWAVDLDSLQVAWIERRIRAGGRCFIVIRRVASAGPRKGKAADELWLYPGRSARSLMIYGLKAGVKPLIRAGGGPSRWPWDLVRQALTN